MEREVPSRFRQARGKLRKKVRVIRSFDEDDSRYRTTREVCTAQFQIILALGTCDSLR